MQRSRRALLQRRAAIENSVLGRNHLYKVSLSLVLLFWGFIFLLISLISHGNSSQDGLEVVDKSTWCEVQDKCTESKGSLESKRSSSNNLDHGVHKEEQNKELYSQNILRVDENHTSGLDIAIENEPLTSEKLDLNLSSIDQQNLQENTTNVETKVEKENPAKNDRLSYIAPALDEFKSKTVTAKGKLMTGQGGSVKHRVEPGGKEYNYASATKGAKVLAFNKEAKGASYILDKDKDKYLRNPCSAEEKFVIIELSEETLVDMIEIANFEHYSSNLKDFQLLSSLVYPTDNWVTIGNFTAANVKQAQRFTLKEPQWARYLKLNLVNHHGSEFYCTLSVLEVYGIDAVERMLEDLMLAQDGRSGPEETKVVEHSPSEHTYEDDPSSRLSTKLDTDQSDIGKETLASRHDNLKEVGIEHVLSEARRTQNGRIPGDNVLKILMQKVRQLDVDFSVLQRYLEELNIRYGKILKDFDKEITDHGLHLERIRKEVQSLQSSKDELTKEILEFILWKSVISMQLADVVKDNTQLRSELEKLRDHQADVDNRSLAVVFMSFLFGSIAAFKIFVDTLLCFFRVQRSENFCRLSSAWIILLLSSGVVALILVL